MTRSKPYRVWTPGNFAAWLPYTQEAPAIKESIKDAIHTISHQGPGA